MRSRPSSTTPAFIASSIEVSPLVMPLRAEPYAFPGLAPGELPRAARTRGGQPAGPLRPGADRRLAGRPGTGAGELQRRRAALLRRAARHGRTGVPPQPRSAAHHLARPRGRGARGPRIRGLREPRRACRIARRGPPRARDARHPQRRDLGRRRTGEGGDRVQPGHAGRPVRPGRPGPGVRVLAAEVRRRHAATATRTRWPIRRATARSNTPTR